MCCRGFCGGMERFGDARCVDYLCEGRAASHGNQTNTRWDLATCGARAGPSAGGDVSQCPPRRLGQPRLASGTDLCCRGHCMEGESLIAPVGSNEVCRAAGGTVALHQSRKGNQLELFVGVLANHAQHLTNAADPHSSAGKKIDGIPESGFIPDRLRFTETPSCLCSSRFHET